MRAALRWGKRNKVISAAGEFDQPVSKGEPSDRWLTRDEVEKLLRVATQHIALFIRLAIASGQRRAAILELPWDRVRLPEAKALQWYVDKVRKIEYERLVEPIIIDFGAGVGNKKRARILIGDNPGLYRAMVEAKALAKSTHVIEYDGKPVAGIKTALTKTFERAGIEPAGAHIFRHSAITWLISAGKTADFVGKLFNVSAEMVERVYGHRSTGALKEVGDVLSLG